MTYLCINLVTGLALVKFKYTKVDEKWLDFYLFCANIWFQTREIVKGWVFAAPISSAIRNNNFYNVIYVNCIDVGITFAICISWCLHLFFFLSAVGLCYLCCQPRHKSCYWSILGEVVQWHTCNMASDCCCCTWCSLHTCGSAWIPTREVAASQLGLSDLMGEGRSFWCKCLLVSF